jgi:5-methylthioribose kinase
MSKLEQIKTTLSTQVSYNDREALEQKLAECVNLLGISASYRAECFKNWQKKRAEVLLENQGHKVAMIKMIVDSESYQESAINLEAERLDVALRNAIDGIKVILSSKDEKDLNL